MIYVTFLILMRCLWFPEIAVLLRQVPKTGNGIALYNFITKSKRINWVDALAVMFIKWHFRVI